MTQIKKLNILSVCKNNSICNQGQCGKAFWKHPLLGKTSSGQFDHKASVLQSGTCCFLIHGNFLFEMGYTMFKNTSRRLSFAGINVNLTVEYY